MPINNIHKYLGKLSTVFHKNTPFPHLIIDNFLDENFINKLKMTDKFYINKKIGKHFNTDFENEKFITNNENLHPIINELLAELSSENWLINLRKLTSINDLFTTDINYAKLSNYHEMSSLGFLGPHVDHGALPGTKFLHVLNIIIYLTHDWKSSYGGGTQFFDFRGHKLVTTVEYKFNRAIIFLHSPYSFHGVEKISVDTPRHLKRKTLYIDYYSKNQNYLKDICGLPTNKWFDHGTYFVLPYYKYFCSFKNIKYFKSFSQYLINKIRTQGDL